MPSIHDQSVYYDNRWSNQTYVNAFGLQRMIAIIQALNYTGLSNPKILDLGSGTGWLTSILNEFGRATGVELSQSAVIDAQQKYPSVEFIHRNIFDTAMDKNAYEVVVSQEVIEHVEDQESYIRIAKECLKEHGYLILTTPNAHNFRNWTKGALDNWNLQPIENWLTISDMKTLLNDLWFEVLYVRTIIPMFGENGVYRLIGSVKLNRLLEIAKLRNWKDRLACRMGLGLHIVMLARKRDKAEYPL